MKNPFRLRLANACSLALLLAIPGHALQGGPVMPEYVQFEPSDAPDVVNLNTGDFSYTLPLGEVSGPYGNFPLSMSYHAGIGPNQEATWVGLGWTLNPGAINRTLRGTPDDQFSGGDLAFIYAYSVTHAFSVGVTLGFDGIGLDMTYNSFAGYGLTASVSMQYGPFDFGVSFGTTGVGVMGGVGIKGFGVNGEIGLHDGGWDAGVTVGYTSPSGASVGASMGVSHEYGGSTAINSGFSVGYHTPAKEGEGEKVVNELKMAQKPKSSGYGASINLSSHGYSVGISVEGTGLAAGSASSNSSSSASNTASLSIPGLFSYSSSTYESWVNQGTTEHTYGYMYQAGPAIFVDGKSEDVLPSGGTGGGKGEWDWKFKGRSLDHVGDPLNGPLLTGYDVFNVAAQGVSGAFRGMALTREQIEMSVEPIEDKEFDLETKFTGGIFSFTPTPNPDESPNVLFYLLKESGETDPLKRRQLNEDFTMNGDNPEAYSQYAYDYCWDKNDASDPYNVHYLGDIPENDKLDKIRNSECSRYAFFKSNHLNEGARLLLSRNKESNLDLGKNFRSRMAFMFMGENGGYFKSETEPGNAITKLNRDALSAALLKKNIHDWKDWGSGGGSGDTWDYPIYGARRIEPVLENNSSVGRLQGFVITNPDGSRYFFTQPVRSLMSASYTTNQPKGGPAFIDRHDPKADENFLDLIKDGWNAFTEQPVETIGNLFKWGGDLVAGSINSFLFYSPTFRDVCQTSDLTKTLSYSYVMSTNPYATQWLLKEIQGPDFVEFSTDNMQANFGYQVKFNYADPVPYAWRAPYAQPAMGNDELPNIRIPKNGQTPENCASELYHASFGVKELVYLKSIETATHKAEFVLNDPQTHERKDGKGWVFSMKGEYSGTGGTGGHYQTTTEGMPILVGTHFPIKQTRGTADPQTTFYINHWHLVSDPPPVGSHHEYDDPYGTNGSITWFSQDVTYSMDGIYIDVQPTQMQIEKMLGKQVIVTGLTKSFTDSSITPNLDASTPNGPPMGWDICAVAYNDPNGKSVSGCVPSLPVGYVFPDYTPTDQSDPNFGKIGVLTATVESIERAEGKDLQYGTYKVKFTNTIVLGHDKIYSGFQLHNQDGTESQNWSTFLNYTADPDDGIPSIPDGGSLSLGSGGGDFKGKPLQPLLVFDDFLDFNDWAGPNGERPHEMRYLDHIDIIDKGHPAGPQRKFKFEYDNSIDPMTLNSYQLGSEQYPNILERHRAGYPVSPSGSDAEPGIDGSSLSGKLKLKSVTEVACGGSNCTDSLSLPPFRFTYWNEGSTSFTAGETWEETLRKSTDILDDWGYWNPYAMNENNKVHQDFADVGGKAWSLRQIIDPSGGVMEVNYERDDYVGESYAEDELAVPIAWNPCVPGDQNSKACFEFVPRKWVTYCDRQDKLKGEWQYFPVGQGGSYAYMNKMGFVQGSELFFNVQQTVSTSVGCGLNLGFWKSGSCERTRSVSVVGSAPITHVSLGANTKPFFDNAGFEAAPNAERSAPDAHAPTAAACTRTDNSCCPADPLLDDSGNPILDQNGHPQYLNPDDQNLPYDLSAILDPADGTYKKSKFWHCNSEVTRVETRLLYKDLQGQMIHTAEKLTQHRRHWKPDGEKFGVVWSRQPTRVLKGGDIRVQELVKRDIGLTQRTHYDYAPGEMAKYPDSAFSMAFATRFSTGKITGLLGDDKTDGFCDPNKTPAQCDVDWAAYIKPYRNLPSQSRIPGIGDQDLDLLPSSTISYPKVTMTNVISDNQGHDQAVNGRAVFEFHAPEERDTWKFRINLIASPAPGETTLRDLYVQFYAGDRSVPILGIQRLHVQGQAGGYFYEGMVQDMNGERVKDIQTISCYYGDPGDNIVSRDVPMTLALQKPFVELVLTGNIQSLSSDWTLAEIQGLTKTRYADFPQPILVRTESMNGDQVTYEDRTSRIGKPKSTTYYRTLKDQAGTEVLVKKDSMVYSDAATSVDERFLGSVDASTLGQQEEDWTYDRNVKCSTSGTPSPGVASCQSPSYSKQWDPYAKLDAKLKGQHSIVHKRYPTFLTESWSISGFNGSRQPDSPTNPHNDDFLVTRVTNHRFDPITGKPTLTVAYSGPGSKDPSKATRTTYAYEVDPSQNQIDLPNLLFVKNVLEPIFREDVFTWDTATTTTNTPSGNALNFNTLDLGGTNGANGGVMAPRLTAVKITPVTQELYQIGQVPLIRQPLVERGDFRPRFNPVTSSNLITNNADLFKYQPDFSQWSGTQINKVNRQLMTVDLSDAYGNHLAKWFDPRGFDQVGIFANARYDETAVLTADGYGPDIDGTIGDRWAFTGTWAPEDNGIKFTGDIDARHRLDIQGAAAGGNPSLYVVEFQAYCLSPITLEVGFSTGPTSLQGDKVMVQLEKGLNAKRVILDANLGYGPNVPLPGENQVYIRSTANTNTNIKYLRAYPEQSQCQTFVHDERGKMIQSVDENNISTYYDYDLLGNLITIRNDDGIALSSQKREMTNR